MATPLDRYRKLGLQESLSRICHYPLACRELASIIKLFYSKFSKILQSLIFQDVLTAFRLLPRMPTQTAISAANNLLQVVESTLPKQKKTLAVTEFKHAIVACKRSSKSRDSEKELVELPQDVLVHVFGFLDLHSFLSASQVCRSWKAASNDNHTWRLIYTKFYNALHNSSLVYQHFLDNIDWRITTKDAYIGISPKKRASFRGFCKHCHAIVWVKDMVNQTSGMKCKYHYIMPKSTRQIVEYVDSEYALSDSDSDSDSDYDSYNVCASKLWVYPKKRSEFL